MTQKKAREPQEPLYYAHAKCMYGRAPEAEELKHIKREFRNAAIINPAAYEDHPDKQKDLKNFCKRLVSQCRLLVFSRILEKITCGVGLEINHALRLGIPVYELRDGAFLPVEKPVRYLSRQQTRDIYRLWKQRFVWNDL
jgi:hypothetical protein